MPEGIELIGAGERAGAGGVDRGSGRAARDERAVAVAMTRLPEEQRTAIVLKEYHGLTFQEIADLQGCPLSTVKTRLYQGLSVLRRHLEQGRRHDSRTREGIMSTTFQCDDKDTLISLCMTRSTRTRAVRSRRICAPARRAPARSKDCASCGTSWRNGSHRCCPSIFRLCRRPATVLRSDALVARCRARVGAGCSGSARHGGRCRDRESTGAVRRRRPPCFHGLDARPRSQLRPPRSHSPRTKTGGPRLTALESDCGANCRWCGRRATPMRRRAPIPTGAAIDANALFRRVQALVNESEERQRQDLAIRMTRFGRRSRNAAAVGHCDGSMASSDN